MSMALRVSMQPRDTGGSKSHSDPLSSVTKKKKKERKAKRQSTVDGDVDSSISNSVTSSAAAMATAIAVTAAVSATDDDQTRVSPIPEEVATPPPPPLPETGPPSESDPLPIETLPKTTAKKNRNNKQKSKPSKPRRRLRGSTETLDDEEEGILGVSETEEDEDLDTICDDDDATLRSEDDLDEDEATEKESVISEMPKNFKQLAKARKYHRHHRSSRIGSIGSSTGGSSFAINRRESGVSKLLGSMTRLFSKNFVKSTDTLFLKTLMNNEVVVEQLAHSKEVTDDDPILPVFPVTADSIRLIEQTKQICEQRIYLDEAKELFSLISGKWMNNLLEIHDEVAAQIENYSEEVEYIDGVSSIYDDYDENGSDTKSRLSGVLEEGIDKTNGEGGSDGSDNDEEETKVETFRVIGVRRKANECLGLTVRLELGRIKVARILIDSVIDRQGLLVPGDTILQINGKDVKQPEDLQKAFEDAGEFIVFKIIPSSGDNPEKEEDDEVRQGQGKFFVRTTFDYNPAEDSLLPCQDIGLRFKHGDILEIVNWTDPSWWQARKVNSKERPGLVPSQDLEERRQCFVAASGLPTNSQASCCGTGGRRTEKRRYQYHVRRNLDFDKAELILYEPVEKMPPFSRKTLVLVSPYGLGKQGLIKKLVDSNPDMYGTTMPLTSRPMGDYETDGEACWFVTQERMVYGMENNEFIDLGEHDSYLFGTTFDAVRNVMTENKLCVLDVRPEALKVLHNSNEFLPFVIFLYPSPPDEYSRMQTQERASRPSQSIELADSRAKRMYEEAEQIRREFQKYFDLELEYETSDKALKKILASLKKLLSENQWVPRNWVFS